MLTSKSPRFHVVQGTKKPLTDQKAHSNRPAIPIRFHKQLLLQTIRTLLLPCLVLSTIVGCCFLQEKVEFYCLSASRLPVFPILPGVEKPVARIVCRFRDATLSVVRFFEVTQRAMTGIVLSHQNRP